MNFVFVRVGKSTQPYVEVFTSTIDKDVFLKCYVHPDLHRRDFLS
jgi:hypothetical protein